VNCPACGHASPDRTKFCPECGAPLAPRCASCRAELLPAAKFCGECGSPAGAAAGQVTEKERPLRDVRAYTPKQALREAERLIAETGARVHEPTLHEERARLAALRGDAAGRERELRAALSLYTERGATGHVERLAREMKR
jgi:predicted RNA-binding Zn-ribbon protein involved in translation (DUF1610 family)